MRSSFLPASQFQVPTDGSAVLGSYQSRVNLFKNKTAARNEAKENAKAISDLSHQLYGEADRSILLVLQGMDTSGKDGTTSAVFNRTPPLNLHVAAFKSPTKTELAQDYLWRIHQNCPPKGHITVFNRSHYEDVLVVKVREFASAETIEQRYEQINAFEKLLVENGTIVLKCMLHISYETQGERLQDRLDVPRKRWKFNPGDLDDRKLWPDFMNAYETMLQRTSGYRPGDFEIG